MASTSSTSSTSPTTDAALSYVEQHRQAFLEGLKDLLRIPSISTLPRHKKDIRRAPKPGPPELARIGLSRAGGIKTPGGPLLFPGRFGWPRKPPMARYGTLLRHPVNRFYC